MDYEEESLIDDILDQIHHYTMCAGEEESARKSYSGYSWDYHGQPLIQEKEKARDKIKATLDYYIDRRIEAVLNNLNENPE